MTKMYNWMEPVYHKTNGKIVSYDHVTRGENGREVSRISLGSDVTKAFEKHKDIMTKNSKDTKNDHRIPSSVNEDIGKVASLEPIYHPEDEHLLPSSRRKVGFDHVVKNFTGDVELHRQHLGDNEKKAWKEHNSLTMQLQQGKHPADKGDKNMTSHIKENIDKMLDQIINRDPAVAETFGAIVATKVASALENMKVDSANAMFNGTDIQESEGHYDLEHELDKADYEGRNDPVQPNKPLKSPPKKGTKIVASFGNNHNIKGTVIGPDTETAGTKFRSDKGDTHVIHHSFMSRDA